MKTVIVGSWRHNQYVDGNRARVHSKVILRSGKGNKLKQAIDLCEKENDYASHDILEKLLKDVEVDHTYWLEQQLGLIDKVGLENYLQSQMSSQKLPASG